MEAREISKYRIESTRLKNWDYSSFGYYFITLCTKDMECFFGRIKDEKIFLSEAGKIVDEEWKNSLKVRKNILLDEFIVMPNHFHSIILLDKSLSETKNKIPNWNPDSLGPIVNQFKGKCTRRIRDLGVKEFHWQSRYYDHIIRNETDLYNIRNYIKYNHLKWNEDRYYRK